MVVLSADQVRAWDQFTISQEPVSSLALMERAAMQVVHWLSVSHYLPGQQFFIFCSKGNNGADGLAIARLLHQQNCVVTVFILEFGQLGTPGFQHNLQALHQLPVPIQFLQPSIPLPVIPSTVLVIDALLGTGLNRPPEGRMAELITHLNDAGNKIISIDLPTGLRANTSSGGINIIKAKVTLTFQCYKFALLLAENADYFGQIVILDIGLHPAFLNTIQPQYDLIDQQLAASIVTIRNPYTHKGNFGHALLLGGSKGKMGALILAAKAVLRTGAGLLSCLVPKIGLNPLQASVPEAMAIVAGEEYLLGEPPVLANFKCIGCGVGIGTQPETAQLLYQLIRQFRLPMVIDADAINIIALQPNWLHDLPPFSILTPHPKEFDRLAGDSHNELERLQKAQQLAIKHQLIIVLKGHNSFVAMPGGKAWFNTSGNASMAKGGSGDVLTGILTSLITRGYAPEKAVLLGVYLHGLAGELASIELGMESVLASDIIQQIGKAFIKINSIEPASA
jgi:ADP-dependent NAD(P)H-hydrate dehydratase / NAD(P)H-hydrate epimerase